MKKITLVFTLLCSVMLLSCKNSEETKDGAQATPALIDAEFPMYSGEYFYSEDGAVLKGNSFIFAVTLDELAKELGEIVAPVKREEYDMIPVIVKGVVTKNPALDQGQQVWEQIITIKEIVSVGNAPAEVDITIDESKS